MLRLLTKVVQPNPKDLKNRDKPMVFRDYHTGAMFEYHLRDSSLACRIPIGADCLADISVPGWGQIS